MQTKLYLALIIGSAALGLTSCSKMGALSADNFNVTPSPIEAVGDQVPVTINGRFPQKYMKKKAVVTVTPVLKYDGGEAIGAPATFQGEKVEGNNQTISYRIGGNYTMKSNFAYVPEMEKSDLYLKFDARKGNRRYNVPKVKVGEGVLATSALVNRTMKSSNIAFAPDAYQHVIKQKANANIKFLIQQAKIRNSELHSVSVKDFIKTLRDIRNDQERKDLENVEVSAYASPDGGMKLNTALAKNREKNTKQYVSGTLKRAGLDGNINTKYTAEDWEGFQQLVSQSNIQDKEVILRVLSMYKDPEERERQIKNISAAFTELAKEVLPELRRSRITVNYNLIGRSDDEIEQQYKSDPSKLSVEEMLYSATLTDDQAKQAEIYKKTTQIYPNDYRAYNNLAVLAYQKGDFTTAKDYVQQALKANSNAAEPNVNAGYLAMLAGDNAAAETYLAKGSTSDAAGEALGNLYLKQGKYAQAVKAFGDAKSNSAGLAQLLTKDYMTAASTLSSVSKPDAMTYYLKAIIAARTNNTSLAIDNLRNAVQQDASLAKYAANDLEFKKIAANAAFQVLTK
ncbi:MAG: hypothetical protein PUH21_04520 [Prevotellaceae bacterium]|nr:hypothetical protein [Prevotellaceae bacterium]MDY3856219.1 hypothetical protein [Bacteroidaceae bacterium]